MRVLVVTNIFPTVSNPGSGTFVVQQIGSLRDMGLKVDVLLVDRTGKGMRAYWDLNNQVRKMIGEFQPDLVHVMYGGVMASVVTGVVQDRPTVVSFCGSDLTGELLSGPIRKLISGYGVISSWKAAKRATGIVVKSRSLLEKLPNSIPRSKVSIIPNGVDLERFKPLNRDMCRNQLRWGSNFFNVLFPANSGDPCKRPDLAKRAVEIVNDMGIRAKFQQLSGIQHDKVPLWLNAADVLLLTSLYEGSPNVVKEALACNLPVVSVDVGDVVERIKGVKGCYLALPTPEDLAAKISAVHLNLRRIDGRTSVENLSLKNIALCLKKFYYEVLEIWRMKHGNLTS